MHGTSSCICTTTQPIDRPAARSRSFPCCPASECELASRLTRAPIVLVLALAAACEIEKVGIQPTTSQLALHGVLSATAPTQVVLLERTRNGTVQSIAPPFDLEVPL